MVVLPEADTETTLPSDHAFKNEVRYIQLTAVNLLPDICGKKIGKYSNRVVSISDIIP